SAIEVCRDHGDCKCAGSEVGTAEHPLALIEEYPHLLTKHESCGDIEAAITIEVSHRKGTNLLTWIDFCSLNKCSIAQTVPNRYGRVASRRHGIGLAVPVEV